MTSDSTGKRSSITRNVMANWLGQCVFIVSGFIVPRLISDWAGREALGVWDVGWSLVSFSALLSLGVTGAVTRYVARYRSLQDWHALNNMVNSGLVLLSVSFVIGLAAAWGFAACVPSLLTSASLETIREAQSVAWILGISAAVQLPLGVFNGVLSGCERFDLKNAVRIGVSLALLCAIVVSLSWECSVAFLAWLVLASELLTGAINYFLAVWICPQFRVAPRLASWSAAREAMAFGGKSMLQTLARSGLYESNKLIMIYFMGPIALAVYARQRALVLVAERFLRQYAHVFIPVSSAIHARGDNDELKALFVESTKYALYISLPIVAALVIVGGTLVQLWMGSDYERPIVLAIFAVGHLGSLVHRPTLSILMGMHKHFAASLLEVLATVTSIILGLLFVGKFGWGMVGAALSVAIPVTISSGVILPILACRALGMDVLRYMVDVLPRPLVAATPFVGWLLFVRWLGWDSIAAVIGLGLGGGAAILGLVYWRWVLPASMKSRFLRALRQVLPTRHPRHAA